MAEQPIVCVRYPLVDLETIDVARAIMGQTVSQFTRTASVALARAIIEARADLDRQGEHGRTSWDQCRIKGSLEPRP